VSTVSAVIPVKDGERYLGEMLDALTREGVDETLVIDSGSCDRSRELARSAGAELIEIPPYEFGHGRTRNLGAERTSGDLICFLTQDATPCPGWLDAFRDAFTLEPGIGAAYGPHLPRPDTSPMIARELEEFFSGFSPDGCPVVQRAGDPSFLSNVNACYARACWEEIRFREIGYAEDQAFGADMLRAGWLKVYAPGAAVLHAHDYPTVEFMRRYFDEYRGLLQATGHIEPYGTLATARYVRAAVAADRRWMSARGMSGAARTAWTGRAAIHHTGRRFFSALGSRSDRLPRRLRSTLSLEGRGGSAARNGSAPDADGGSRRAGAGSAPGRPAESSPVPASKAVPKKLSAEVYHVAARVWRNGPAPLLDPLPGMAERERLRLAMVIPPFSRGSGGHNTLFQIFSRLERRGHACSVWLADPYGYALAVWPAVLRHDINEFFAPFKGPVYKGFDAWQGADVAIATGWQTVHAMLELDQCRARAYVVNDHESDFFPASAEHVLAAETYGYGMHCIAASPWLRDLLIDRYDASAEAFQLGVDHDTYRPRPVARQPATVIYYARHATPRRAVPFGLMALAELKRRRPEVRVVLFGSDEVLDASFPFEHIGVLGPTELSWLYSEATVGLCLSLTNFSLMPKEMLACGLPCVELEGISAESIFGSDGPLALAPLDSNRIADALERLIDDSSEWERRSRQGIEFVASHTWEQATDEVEAALRHALREREGAAAAQP
jgi:glycosyltransferase involved in cell wall biosynthesis/GT2 family glycosyltransferase